MALSTYKHTGQLLLRQRHATSLVQPVAGTQISL
jgi:hypothetical protein